MMQSSQRAHLWRLTVTTAIVFLAAPAIAQQQEKPGSAEADQRERQLFDAAAGLESEIKRLDSDLDDLIEKASASQKDDAKAQPPAQQRPAPAPAAPR